MSGYDEDDIIDYGNDGVGEEFNEDALNDDEYDQLYELLPSFKAKTKDYQLEDIELKEILWNNFFDLDASIGEVRSTFKPTLTQKPLSKLQLLAQKKKQEAAGQHSASKGLSGLSGLSGLAGLRSGNQKKGLSTLVKKKETTGTPSLLKRLSAKTEPTGLAGLTVKVTRRKPESNVVATIKEQPPEQPYEFELAMELPTLSILTNHSNNKLSHFFFHSQHSDQQEVKRRLLGSSYERIFTTVTNNSELAKKSASNFVKPSPDDQVKSISQLAENVSDINLEPTKTTKPKKIVATKPKKKINIDDELNKKNEKPNLSFVVMGHVDSGKSTLIGRLLYDLGIVDSKTLHKLTKESEAIGKASFSLAWVMDQTSEERNRGVTVDICQTQIETDKSRFTIIDSPGHKAYVPQMINGVSQADIAVVVIDASSFESGFGSNGQTKEHLTIARSLGIDRCIVVINKMDTVDWSEERFGTISSQVGEFLVHELKYEAKQITYIPTSGYLGDNVVKKSAKLGWYDTGKTLVEVLEEENKARNHQIRKSEMFVLTINDVQSTNKNDELLVSGRINSGILQPGESIKISPSQEIAVVDSISITNSNVGSSIIKNEVQNLAVEGEFVELKLKKLDNVDNIKVGDLATSVDKEIKAVTKFQCKLNMFNLDRPLLIGTPFILFRNNISIPARLSKIESIGSKDGVKKKSKRHLSSNVRASVEVEVMEREIPLLTYEQNNKLGGLVIRKGDATIGAGTVTELE